MQDSLNNATWMKCWARQVWLLRCSIYTELPRIDCRVWKPSSIYLSDLHQVRLMPRLLHLLLFIQTPRIDSHCWYTLYTLPNTCPPMKLVIQCFVADRMFLKHYCEFWTNCGEMGKPGKIRAVEIKLNHMVSYLSILAGYRLCIIGQFLQAILHLDLIANSNLANVCFFLSDNR